MPYMHPAPEPRAFNMRSGAMKAPMPDLVTEPTEFPRGALFVTVIGIICTALAAVVTGQPHFWMRSNLLGAAHGYFIQGWSFQ